MFAKSVYASCPVCVITVGGGLLLAEKLGIDDLLVAIWISGLNTAIAFYIADKIKNKYFRNPIFWSVVLYLSTYFYLFHTKQIGHPGNMHMGIDKVFFGMTVGMVVFWIGVYLEKYMKYINKNKVFFYYQKVVIPFVLLVLATAIMNFMM